MNNLRVLCENIDDDECEFVDSPFSPLIELAMLRMHTSLFSADCKFLHLKKKKTEKEKK